MSAVASGAIPLAEYHTLNLPVYAERLLLPQSEEEVASIADQADIIIGEGSNIFPRKHLPAVLSTRYLRGYRVLREDTKHVEVEVAAGENWDAWVRLCIACGWHGIENLAAIPGTVGAAVVQNIGAYGVELAPFLVSVRGWNKSIEAWQEIPAEACKLTYRHSIFQTPEWRDKFIITRVTLRLKRQYEPVLTYPDVQRRVDPSRQHDPWHLYQTVRAIRAEKLPATGSAGSFFKNPILSASELQQLREKAPDVPFYPQPDGRYKVSAAWLIDKAGLKGYQIGAAQVYPRQPLVLVNTGGATPEELWQLAQYVQKTVYERWGIKLEPEVRIIPE
ncbi:MAG: UDP-N-acetylmuramate dehydrogenase [Bacteroidia bacterium]|nr:UDP-N-acetylmuramate dehydrogenase [Bacteroidia bacterium]MCX7764160.1 UDP-N-acetylmuramate dehydrogenase [Bacteroidia bacterium]MDW8057665.1 UDP-N-acetylmuramate dehydrogenase [Bacteroidia bacterium]